MLSSQNKTYLYIIFFFSVLSLCVAYFIQYILKHQPCNLCLIERIPYFVASIILPLMFFVKKHEKIYLVFITLFFLGGAFISLYHVGIEQGIFKESFVCSLNKDLKDLTPEKLLKNLELRNVSCKEVTFKFLGLSLATFNTIISFIISAILIRIIKYEKNK